MNHQTNNFITIAISQTMPSLKKQRQSIVGSHLNISGDRFIISNYNFEFLGDTKFKFKPHKNIQSQIKIYSYKVMRTAVKCKLRQVIHKYFYKSYKMTAIAILQQNLDQQQYTYLQTGRNKEPVLICSNKQVIQNQLFRYNTNRPIRPHFGSYR